MQGGYHTRQWQRLQQLKEASSASMPKTLVYWAIEKHQWCTRGNVHFLIVANEAELQQHVKQD